jgi:predicted DNA-binding protein with PD1-like motif
LEDKAVVGRQITALLNKAKIELASVTSVGDLNTGAMMPSKPAALEETKEPA